MNSCPKAFKNGPTKVQKVAVKWSKNGPNGVQKVTKKVVRIWSKYWPQIAQKWTKKVDILTTLFQRNTVSVNRPVWLSWLELSTLNPKVHGSTPVKVLKYFIYMLTVLIASYHSKTYFSIYGYPGSVLACRQTELRKWLATAMARPVTHHKIGQPLNLTLEIPQPEKLSPRKSDFEI